MLHAFRVPSVRRLHLRMFVVTAVCHFDLDKPNFAPLLSLAVNLGTPWPPSYLVSLETIGGQNEFNM